MAAVFAVGVAPVGCGFMVEGDTFTLSPGQAQVNVGETLQFGVIGTRPERLFWFVNGKLSGDSGVGSISASGVYQAPVIPPTPNAVQITARLRKNDKVEQQAIITVFNPAPVVQQARGTGVARGQSVLVTLDGSGFAQQSEVRMGSQALPTTLVSKTRLQATLSLPGVVSGAEFDLEVFTPAPGGGTTPPIRILVVGEGTVEPTIHPQVARYTITVPREAGVRIEFGPSASYGLRTWTKQVPPGGGTAEILVAGMRAFTAYHVRAVVEFADGLTHFDSDHTFTTGGLPEEKRPTITVSRPEGLEPTPGVMMLSLNAGEPKVGPVVTDLEGNVLWYYEGVQDFAFPLKLLPWGNLLLIDPPPDGSTWFLREIDLTGRTLREISHTELAARFEARGMNPALAGFFHHDMAALPNGNIMLLTAEFRTLTDMAGFDGQPVILFGDALVELDTNFDPVWTWTSFDHLDVNRHRLVQPAPPEVYDWTHGNAVVYSPADGNLLVSLRHQHWVIKIDYRDGNGTGAILWRFGNEGDFTLENGTAADWQYGQHFPFFVDNGQVRYRLAVFDNGNARPLAGGGTCGPVSGVACFSRAVIYELDEAAMTARVVFEHRPGRFAPFIGSAQVLENGNVVYNVGTDRGTPETLILEVTQEASPRRVWEMQVRGQFSYRGVRLPSLYPGVQW